jgi:hypothetical protein
VVLKYAKENEAGRAGAVASGCYKKECNFFDGPLKVTMPLEHTDLRAAWLLLLLFLLLPPPPSCCY